jgi:16S rRNA processing protein RimM
MDLPPPEFSRSATSRGETGKFGLEADASGSSGPDPNAVRDPENLRSDAEHPASGSSAAPSPFTLVAKLVRPHGRRGELVADLLTDFPERFHERSRLFLIPPPSIGTAAREIRLENYWFQRSRVVLKFQGVDSINDAEGLRGYEVAIPSSERAGLHDGSVYVSELIGCSLVDLNQSAADVGEIVDVERGASSSDLLIVHRRGLRGTAADVQIPFVRDYLVRIDLAGRSVEMRLPAGLLDINAPLTDEEKQENRGA